MVSNVFRRIPDLLDPAELSFVTLNEGAHRVVGSLSPRAGARREPRESKPTRATDDSRSARARATVSATPVFPAPRSVQTPQESPWIRGGQGGPARFEAPIPFAGQRLRFRSPMEPKQRTAPARASRSLRRRPRAGSFVHRAWKRPPRRTDRLTAPPIRRLRGASMRGTVGQVDRTSVAAPRSALPGASVPPRRLQGHPRCGEVPRRTRCRSPEPTAEYRR